MKTLLKEVKGLNPTFDGADIRGEYIMLLQYVPFDLIM